MDISTLQKLAGIHEYKGYTEYTLEDMSQTASDLKKKESDKDNTSFKWTSSKNENETVFNEGYNNPKITCTDKDGNVFSRDKNIYKSCDELFEKISNNNSEGNNATNDEQLKKVQKKDGLAPISKPTF